MIPGARRWLSLRIPSWTRPQVIKVVWLLCALIVGWRSRDGSDFQHYTNWVEVFESSDILKIRSNVLSPVGVPVTHWSSAPALVMDSLNRALRLLPFLEVDTHLVPWLVAIAFWWATIGLARLITRGDAALVTLTIAAVFIGTHAGFYSNYHSSEIFSLASLAIATYWALSSGPERLRDSLIIGIVCGLLLFVRVNLIMYLPLPLVVRAFIVWRGQTGRLKRALHLLALALPLLVYAVLLSLFNYWMTGSPGKSPYVYGDEQFHSLDLAKPMFGTMLFHSWHGLLTYHPIFALGPIALAALALRRDLPRPERLLFGYTWLALLVQLWVQAGWWCWWNGTQTFGNRTLALGGVVTVAALARWLSLLKQDATRKSLALLFTLLFLITASCFWSYLLYIQGNTNWVTWKLLLDGQRRYIIDPPVFLPLCVAGLMSVGFAVIAFRSLRSRAVLIAFTIAIASLATQGLFHTMFDWTPVRLSLLTAAVSCLIIYLATDRETSAVPVRFARTVVAVAVLWVFFVGSWTFRNVTIATESVIANATANVRHYRYRSTMVLPDLLACVSEYDRVEGFEDRKAAAKRYIEAAAQEGRRK